MTRRTIDPPLALAVRLRRMRSPAAAILLVAAASLPLPDAAAEDPAPGPADVLVLRDGRRLEGSVVAEDATGVTFRSGGTTRFHSADAIERIDRAADASTQPREGGAAEPAQRAGTGDATTAAPGVAPERRTPPQAPRAAPLSDEARRWFVELAARAGSGDEQVRRSVAAALRALGPATLPALRAAAEAAQDPAARSLLLRVAEEFDVAPGPPRDGPAPAGPSPGGPSRPDPTPPDGRRPARGALFEKVASELELRDEQRPGFLRVLGTLERESQGILRLVRQEGLAPAEASAKLEELKSRTRMAALEVLDAGQSEAFEPLLVRYVDGQLDRATKAARQPAREKP